MTAMSSMRRPSAITAPSPARPSRRLGTDVMLNVAWLDEAQLQVMHRTEAVGVAYDYVRLFTGTVTHLSVVAAGGDIVPPVPTGVRLQRAKRRS